MTTRTNDEKFTASFVFYCSFADMISKIPDREIRLQAYEMLFEYALFGTEPQIEHWAVEMVFSAVKPQIDANNKRRKNGKKGGRKPTQEKATQTQAEAEAQPAVQAQPAAQTQPAMQVEIAAQTTSAIQAQPAIQAKPSTQIEPAMQAQPTATAKVEAAVQLEAPVQVEPEQLEKIVHFGENRYPTTPTEKPSPSLTCTRAIC